MLWYLSPLISILCTLVVAQKPGDSGNHFINPPVPVADSHVYTNNPVYAINSTIEISFVTDWQDYNIDLYQQDLTDSSQGIGGPIIYSSNINPNGTKSFNWVVQTYDFGAGSNVFYFSLFHLGSPVPAIGDLITSSFFNVTTSSSTPLSLAGSSPTPLSNTISHSGSNITLGLAVGLGLGLLLCLAIGGAIGFFVGKRKRGYNYIPGGASAGSQHTAYSGYRVSRGPPSELPEHGVEMPKRGNEIELDATDDVWNPARGSRWT